MPMVQTLNKLPHKESLVWACIVSSFSLFLHIALLQIGRGYGDNLGMILFLLKNISCHSSLEPPCKDRSNMGSQETRKINSELASNPHLIWSSDTER